MTEITNISALVFDGKERLSDIVFQLDVWDTQRKKTEETAAQADVLMLGAGFRRTLGQAVREKNLHRKCLRYAGKIDLINFTVYTNIHLRSV